MARAGFCSECGDNVYLTGEGGCPEGHGPECIRDEYAVDASPAQGDEAQAEATDVIAADAAGNVDSPTMTPVPPTAGGDMPPARNRTGMLVFAAAAVLLLIALIAGAFAMLPALKKGAGDGTEDGTGLAGSKARVETAVDFLSALFADDTIRIRPLLTEEARNAITDEQWDAIASAFPTATVVFTKPDWTSDSTAVVGVSTGGSEATLTVGATPNSTDTVNVVLDVGEGQERAILRLVQEAEGWRVLSITDETGGATLYDDAFVESLYEEATGQ